MRRQRSALEVQRVVRQSHIVREQPALCSRIVKRFTDGPVFLRYKRQDPIRSQRRASFLAAAATAPRPSSPAFSPAHRRRRAAKQHPHRAWLRALSSRIASGGSTRTDISIGFWLLVPPALTNVGQAADQHHREQKHHRRWLVGRKPSSAPATARPIASSHGGGCQRSCPNRPRPMRRSARRSKVRSNQPGHQARRRGSSCCWASEKARPMQACRSVPYLASFLFGQGISA